MNPTDFHHAAKTTILAMIFHFRNVWELCSMGTKGTVNAYAELTSGYRSRNIAQSWQDISFSNYTWENFDSEEAGKLSLSQSENVHGMAFIADSGSCWHRRWGMIKRKRQRSDHENEYLQTGTQRHTSCSFSERASNEKKESTRHNVVGGKRALIGSL